MANHSTVGQLVLLCANYKSHLEESISNFALEMPENVVESYLQADEFGEKKIDVKRVIVQANSGHSLYWGSKELMNKYYVLENRPHSVNFHPELHLAIQKHNIVTSMLSKLTDKKVNSDEQHIVDMMAVLTPKAREILKERSDSSNGARFLESIFHVITLGIYSKLTKGTFAFWKSHGEALTDNVEERVLESVVECR